MRIFMKKFFVLESEIFFQLFESMLSSLSKGFEEFLSESE
jgi:hypothetical protein